MKVNILFIFLVSNILYNYFRIAMHQNITPNTIQNKCPNKLIPGKSPIKILITIAVIHQPYSGLFCFQSQSVYAVKSAREKPEIQIVLHFAKNVSITHTNIAFVIKNSNIFLNQILISKRFQK